MIIVFVNQDKYFTFINISSLSLYILLKPKQVLKKYIDFQSLRSINKRHYKAIIKFI